jgi:processive 1,2-diacylglycerol beta-glucosyltransferase
VTGIPIDPRFAHPMGRDTARAELGIPAGPPMVLIMGGGSGVGPLAELAERLARLPQTPTVVVVCGTNLRLRREVEQAARSLANGGAHGTIRAIGFTDQVDALLEACDVVVSKAGGLTSSEALVKSAPLVVYKPTPGQEVRNAEYLERGRAARLAESIEEVESAVAAWLADPAARAAVREASTRLATPHAAEEIARVVLDALPARHGAAPAA